VSISYKNILFSLIITITLGFAIWATLSNVPGNNVLAKTKLLPDAFMEDVTSTVMDKQGKVKMKIISPKMTHYAESDTTQLLNPQLILHRKSPTPWYINSRYGEATHGTDNVKFWDDVVIRHAADQTNPPTLIKTSSLLIHPDAQTAETIDPITLTQPSLTVKATGMYADMASGNIKLLSKARGEYAPT